MNAAMGAAIQAHVARVQRMIQRAGLGLASIVLEVRGELLGPDWSAALAQVYGTPPEGVESPAALARRAQHLRISPAVSGTAEVIRLRLFDKSKVLIEARMRRVYTFDFIERARIYDRFTNPGVRIQPRVTVDELAALDQLPILGRPLGDLLLGTLNELRDNFRGAVVRAVAGTRGGVQSGQRALAVEVDRVFEQWRTKAAKVASLAAEAAFYASQRELRRGLMRPAARAGVA